MTQYQSLFFLFVLSVAMTVNLEVPSPLRAGLEVTAVCSGNDIHGSAALTWYLNGVQITDGFTTTSEIIRSDDYCTFFGLD